MIDSELQGRFAHGCAEAACGYAVAATAAYTDMAHKALDFWSTAFEGLASPETATKEASMWSTPARASCAEEPPFGFALSDWTGMPWLDPGRWDRAARVSPTDTPMAAMLSFSGLFPLRGATTSWPMACLLISSGVPRKVAWPTAEASAAALDAADAASTSMRRAFSSYHSDSGHAVAHRTSNAIASAALAAAFPAAIGLTGNASMFTAWMSPLTV